MSEDASAQVQTSDPLKTVADAMEHAVQAAKDGAMDAKARVDQALPGVNRFVVTVRIYNVLHDLLWGRVPSVLWRGRSPRTIRSSTAWSMVLTPPSTWSTR